MPIPQIIGVTHSNGHSRRISTKRPFWDEIFAAKLKDFKSAILHICRCINKFQFKLSLDEEFKNNHWKFENEIISNQ